MQQDKFGQNKTGRTMKLRKATYLMTLNKYNSLTTSVMIAFVQSVFMGMH